MCSRNKQKTLVAVHAVIYDRQIFNVPVNSGLQILPNKSLGTDMMPSNSPCLSQTTAVRVDVADTITNSYLMFQRGLLSFMMIGEVCVSSWGLVGSSKVSVTNGSTSAFSPPSCEEYSLKETTAIQQTTDNGCSIEL